MSTALAVEIAHPRSLLFLRRDGKKVYVSAGAYRALGRPQHLQPSIRADGRFVLRATTDTETGWPVWRDRDSDCCWVAAGALRRVRLQLGRTSLHREGDSLVSDEPVLTR